MSASIVNSPLLPRPLSAPLALLPGAVHSRMLATALNAVLSAPLGEGALDFLAHRTISIALRDADLVWSLTLIDGRLCAALPADQPDLTINATVYDLLCLAGREVDPDTLVFQRRLVIQGDTELGLQVKNCLDSLDGDSLWLYAPLETLLQKLLPLYRRVCA